MNSELSQYAARFRAALTAGFAPGQFSSCARELFALQFQHNAVYQKICVARGVTPGSLSDWTAIPAVPAAAFKELTLTCLPPAEQTAVFHSSGTTEQKPSRHFHSSESLGVYEASLWQWFQPNFPLPAGVNLIFLTPPPAQTPHSSLVHMFAVLRQQHRQPAERFYGRVGADGAWELDFAGVRAALAAAVPSGPPVAVFGTAFSFVHLLDHLAAAGQRIALPKGSRVMETGGYKNRSRSLPKNELHALITDRLGVPRDNIVCEYGMSELSSQAYDGAGAARVFHFPPWAQVRLLSPETGAEVAEGETGLIRVHDLANVFSVAAIQTEDLAVRRGNGFELLGRAPAAEPRGCSLMTA